MSEDPLSVLEEAVREVEDALRDGLGGLASGPPVADTPAREASPSGAPRADEMPPGDTDLAPGAAERLAALEREREAVRQRLHALRDRLTLIAETTPEPTDP